MGVQTNTLIFQLQQQRTSATYEPVIAIINQLIAALQELAAGATGGTVTSVSASIDAGEYTVNVTNPTTTPAIALTLNTQTANTLWAGPTTGVAATPTFRSLVAADLNSLGFTTGSIPFGNASGGLSQNNVNLFWDNTNKRIGIGSNTLNSSIEVINGNPTNPTASISLYSGATNKYTAYSLARTKAQIDGYWAVAGSVGNFVLDSIVGDMVFATFAPTNHILFGNTNSGTGTSNSTLSVIGATVGVNKTNPIVSLDVTGQLRATGAYIDASYSYQTPLTGFNITIGNTVGMLILDPAGVLATGTITMPAAPQDGQLCGFSSSQTVTALTHNANAGQSIHGALTTLTANKGYQWQYVASNTTWFVRV